MKIDVCFCSDVNLVGHIPTVVNSILDKNSEHEMTIHLIHNMDEDEMNGLNMFCEDKNLELKTYHKTWEHHYDSPLKGTITDTTMLRLYIPELIDVSRLIYLDIDVLVNMDLSPLQKLGCGKTGIAIKDSIYSSWRTGKSGKQSGNCGVMVMNLDVLRENNFTKKCIDVFLSGKYGNELHDQDIINIYCDGNHARLPKHYNIYIGQDDSLVGKNKEYILHFAGKRKPYKADSGLVKKFQRMWDKHIHDSKEGLIALGVLHYKNSYVGGASSNIGDYVQTLAQLNIYRKFVEEHNGVEYEFEDFIKGVNTNTIKNFDFIFIQRDNMEASPNIKGKENIITILNGWWIHPIDLNKSIKFKVPKEVNPIFTSFHIANEKMYQDQYINVLKQHQPIGCRDISTTERLKEKGVDTFFSGCLTTTIDFLKYDKKNDDIHIVDTKGDGVFSSQMNPKWKNSNPRESILEAYEMLKKYSECGEVKTSRLHCYLPCLAMGVPVKFQSPDGDDKKTWGSPNRFEGLFELSEDVESFEKIQKDLLDFCISEIKMKI